MTSVRVHLAITALPTDSTAVLSSSMRDRPPAQEHSLRARESVKYTRASRTAQLSKPSQGAHSSSNRDVSLAA